MKRLVGLPLFAEEKVLGPTPEVLRRRALVDGLESRTRQLENNRKGERFKAAMVGAVETEEEEEEESSGCLRLK